MIKQPGNMHQWDEFARHWEGIDGIDSVYLAHYSTFDGGVDSINEIGRQFAEQNPQQARQMQRQRALSQYPCYYPWHSISVTWEGNVVPCCRDYDESMILGDLNRESLMHIWNGSAMQDLRRRFAHGLPIGRPCENCSEASLETGLPGRHYPVSKWSRRLGIGRMAKHVTRPDDHAGLSGAQNLNRDEHHKFTQMTVGGARQTGEVGR